MSTATMTIGQVAALLGVSRNTAYTAAQSGQIAGVPVIRVGRRLLVPTAALNERLGLQPEGEKE